MLPALLLGFLPGEKNELYDWAQHLVAGLVFGIIFVLTFLGGDWRRHWVIPFTGVAAGTIIAAVIWRQGLPNFQGIFALAGSMVGGGYWFSQRREKPILIETVFVAVGSVARSIRPSSNHSSTPEKKPTVVLSTVPKKRTLVSTEKLAASELFQI